MRTSTLTINLKRTPTLTRTLMYFAVLLSLAACGVAQAPIEPIAATGNPGEIVSQLDSQIIDGRKNQFNVMSPTLFAKAEQNLQAAKQALDRGDEIADILERVAEARAQLKSAAENTEIARTALVDAIKAREDAGPPGPPFSNLTIPKSRKAFSN